MRRQIILSILILVFSLTLYSSPKNKLRDIYEITEEKVYAVRISIPTMADLEKLKDLGIVCRSPGKLSIKVTEAKFEELNEAGFEVDIVKKAIEVQGKRESFPVPKLREYKPGENGEDRPIPDDGGATWQYSPITITSAPSGASVTTIDVHYEIVHTWPTDLIVDLTDATMDVEYRLWDKESSYDNINVTEYGIEDFEGELVNQTWYLYALDLYTGGEGYIDYWKITVYYGEGYPDLKITNVEVSNDEPWEWESIDVTLTITNQGNGPIPPGTNFWTDLFYNEISQPSPSASGNVYFLTPSLSAGESITHTFEDITTDAPGEWKMYGLIDSDNRVYESNESNNGYGPIRVFWKEQAFNDYYGWPVKNPDFDDQSPLSGTFMEFRTGNRFHNAIDVCGSVGKATYNVSAGEVTNRLIDDINGQTRIGNFNYIHLVDMPSYTIRSWVNSDTLIGFTNDLDHVHLSDGADGSEVNPLRRQGINPYLDTEAPEIIDVSLVRDGTLYDKVDLDDLKGKIDIIAHARDDISMQCTTGPKAVYRIGYQVLTVHNEPIYNIQFDNWLSSDNINYVYAIDGTNLTRMTSSGSEHYYIVTNNMTSNNYLDASSLPAGDLTLRIIAQDIRGWDGTTYQYNTSEPFDVKITVYPTEIKEDKKIPKTFAIHQNFPNPFSQKTEINYQLPEECNVELAIYNVIGERVKTLTDKKQSPGYYNMHWSGKDFREEKVPTGTYFLIFKAGKFQDHKKIVKLQ